MYPHKVITCRALYPVVRELLPIDTPLAVLEIALHLQPERLRTALNETIAEIEQEGERILLGYGLCGRALEGVVSRKSTLILPRVDDCVGALLGSKRRHREILSSCPGSYFLEPSWLDNELNIFTQLGKDLGNISYERRRQLLKIALKHYKYLVLLEPKGGDEEAARRCAGLAREYEMVFQRMVSEIGLVDRLLHGPWDEVEFVVVSPGTPIPLF